MFFMFSFSIQYKRMHQEITFKVGIKPQLRQQMIAQSLPEKNNLNQYKQCLKEFRLTLGQPLPLQKKEQLVKYFSEMMGFFSDNQQAKIEKNPQNQPILQKIILYTWQIANVFCLENKIHQNHIQYLITLVEQTHAANYYENCYKAMLICVFNLVKNSKIAGNHELCYQLIKKQCEKKQLGQQEFEWLIYLVEICNQHFDGLIKEITKDKQNIGQIIHFFGTVLNKIVEDRSSTEIVKGYPCPIEDVRNMYNKKQIINFKLSWIDYEYIISDVLEFYCSIYKKQLKMYLEEDLSKKQIQSITGILVDLLGICNCVMFLGGYNPTLQSRTIKIIMKNMLFLLQISFLLYNEGEKRKRKVNVQMNINYQENLCKLLEINKIEAKDYTKLIYEGQLANIIRLLSNLVHISEEGQKYFEEDLRYFRLILSLTHESESQLTMKNWAIVFIRNVSERSAVMREEIEKLQINVKTV